jgi:hypothetical protein
MNVDKGWFHNEMFVNITNKKSLLTMAIPTAYSEDEIFKFFSHYENDIFSILNVIILVQPGLIILSFKFPAQIVP